MDFPDFNFGDDHDDEEESKDNNTNISNKFQFSENNNKPQLEQQSSNNLFFNQKFSTRPNLLNNLSLQKNFQSHISINNQNQQQLDLDSPKSQVNLKFEMKFSLEAKFSLNSQKNSRMLENRNSFQLNPQYSQPTPMLLMRKSTNQNDFAIPSIAESSKGYEEVHNVLQRFSSMENKYQYNNNNNNNNSTQQNQQNSQQQQGQQQQIFKSQHFGQEANQENNNDDHNNDQIIFNNDLIILNNNYTSSQQQQQQQQSQQQIQSTSHLNEMVIVNNTSYDNKQNQTSEYTQNQQQQQSQQSSSQKQQQQQPIKKQQSMFKNANKYFVSNFLNHLQIIKKDDEQSLFYKIIMNTKKTGKSQRKVDLFTLVHYRLMFLKIQPQNYNQFNNQDISLHKQVFQIDQGGDQLQNWSQQDIDMVNDIKMQFCEEGRKYFVQEEGNDIYEKIQSKDWDINMKNGYLKWISRIFKKIVEMEKGDYIYRI